MDAKEVLEKQEAEKQVAAYRAAWKFIVDKVDELMKLKAHGLEESAKVMDALSMIGPVVMAVRVQQRAEENKDV